MFVKKLTNAKSQININIKQNNYFKLKKQLLDTYLCKK